MSEDFKIKFQPLFRITWYLSFLMLILMIVHLVVYVVVPPPQSVKGIFELFEQNPVLGIISFDLLYMINNFIMIFIFLTLFMLLYHERPTTSVLGLVFGLIAIACYYPSNPTFEMLSLSVKYFQAPLVDQALFIAAGEALMAGYTGTSFDVYYVFSALALILFNYALLKSPNHKKSLGGWGMTSAIFMVVPSSAGLIGMVFALLSLIPWAVFVVLFMMRLRVLSFK